MLPSIATTESPAPVLICWPSSTLPRSVRPNAVKPPSVKTGVLATDGLLKVLPRRYSKSEGPACPIAYTQVVRAKHTTADTLRNIRTGSCQHADSGIGKDNSPTNQDRYQRIFAGSEQGQQKVDQHDSRRHRRELAQLPPAGTCPQDKLPIARRSTPQARARLPSAGNPAPPIDRPRNEPCHRHASHHARPDPSFGDPFDHVVGLAFVRIRIGVNNRRDTKEDVANQADSSLMDL